MYLHQDMDRRRVIPYGLGHLLVLRLSTVHGVSVICYHWTTDGDGVVCRSVGTQYGCPPVFDRVCLDLSIWSYLGNPGCLGRGLYPTTCQMHIQQFACGPFCRSMCQGALGFVRILHVCPDDTCLLLLAPTWFHWNFWYTQWRWRSLVYCLVIPDPQNILLYWLGCIVHWRCNKYLPI